MQGIKETVSRSRRRRHPHIQLQELRINRGWSPADLAFHAGIDQKTVRMAEAGWKPSPRTQFAIASQFEMKPTDLWPLTRETARR